MGTVTVILHRWALALPDTEVQVDQVAGDAPDEVRYGGALYERILGTLPPTYSFVRLEGPRHRSPLES